MAVLLAVLALLPLAAAAPAQPDAPRDLYVFGNSLVHHPDEPRANVPHWLALMAEADGRALRIDGQWGFLRDFAAADPAPGWAIEGVARQDSADPADFTDIVVTPTNFIQYQPADRSYEGDDRSPLDATLAVLDRAAARAPDATFHIYEGWADMAQFTRAFPPSRRALRRYHRFNLGDYHDWYVDYVDALRRARPALDIRLIPVAPALSAVMTQDPLDDLDATDLYLDDAPHGTEATYLLAAASVYAALYGAAAPADLELPATLPDPLRAAWPEIAGAIAATVAECDHAAAPAPTRTAAATDLPARQDHDLPPAGALPEGAPALGLGLNGISDWSTQHPFVDVMKTARDWVGHLPGQWGGMDGDALRAAGHLSPEGWPLRIPDGVERLETFVLTDQPEAADHLRGAYVLRWQGTGRIELSGRAGRVQRRGQEIRFHYAPGPDPVGIVLLETDPDDPVRDITIVREDYLRLHEAGVVFNPDWIERVRHVRVLRFMDWMMTNGSTLTAWEDRPEPADRTWAVRGAPVEIMVALANQVGADPWFTLPHAADDAFVRAFATAVRDTLDPRLRAHVEYSNEVWNRIFPQADWAEDQARARWGESEAGWMQFYGLRAAQVMDIWTEVFGPEAEARLVRVVSTQTGWPGLEAQVLTAPLAYLELGRMPRDSFDAYAVTGYFGYEVAAEDMAPRIDAWLDAAEAAAQDAGAAEGLSRVALREYVRANRFAPAFPALARAIREGSLAALTDELFPYHAAVAAEAGLQLVMYEGGSHAVAQGARVADARLTEFLNAFSYAPEMAALYQEALAGWTAAGGRLFNAFVDVAAPSKWGSWGGLRHLDDANPRWDVLMAHNASAPVDWDPREPEVFADGRVAAAPARGGDLVGTPEEDILLGGPGDDVLVSGGGSDALHGGAGRDRAILPGLSTDYSFAEDGPRLVATRGTVRVTMVAIEEMGFAGDPGTVVPTN
ncbi:type I secretion protein [Roseivivax isoporae]|uniref:Type I secretion protein n=1 Tax=Roseivivax isoporae LMG 25204 TaxID=1449351 RepID=X7FC83_9RHOB|nr:type I secretion protein [Roseivivax isoporae]ETX30425.1 type I secretion protein [Roseivivax isoporae LMG 25204]